MSCTYIRYSAKACFKTPWALQPTVSRTSPPFTNRALLWDPWALQPDSRTCPYLPSSSTNSRTWLHPRWVSDSFGDFWTLTLPNSNQHCPQDPHGLQSQPLHDPVPPPAASTQVASQAYQTTHIACHERDPHGGKHCSIWVW